MKIKVEYDIRWKNDNRWCTREHIEITEDDLLEYVKQFRPPSTDDLYIDDEIEITGFNT